IENCYSTGTVTSNGWKVGGLLGDADGENSTVSKCYSVGLVNGSHKKGLVGYNFRNPNIRDSYWDVQTSGCSSSYGGTGKQTAQMMQQATFVNWDFEQIWDIVENETYPFLRPRSPRAAAVREILDAIAGKSELLLDIEAALEHEQAAYYALEELLESGDYGNLWKGDIIKAQQKIHSAIQHERQSKNALEKSIEKLYESLEDLGWEPPPMPEPIAHWTFDEGSGTIAEDSAGSNDGTLINGPVWTTGQIDGALYFSGGDDYIDCGNSFASITGSTTKTITAWAKSDVSDRSGRIITLYRRSDSYSAFVIYPRENDGVNPATWKGLYATPGNGHKLIDSAVSVTAGEWIHVALVQDGPHVHIYVNGELENSASDAAAPTISNPPNAVIGTYMWYGHGPSASFLGTIDDVRLYNRALSAEEIRQLYNLTNSDDRKWQ
ncbi:LamG domain-containing protein, partial [bacterium]|nr:LamG domain-containing protein [bacterium]